MIFNPVRHGKGGYQPDTPLNVTIKNTSTSACSLYIPLVGGSKSVNIAVGESRTFTTVRALRIAMITTAGQKIKIISGIVSWASYAIVAMSFLTDSSIEIL